ncbi:ATP-binding protein [Legionella birminghamensis]|uniref:ATP-binding protein n=1 Tax=Legionella birminghamensis TaxID=28083 RepID=UPI0013EF9A91|nr:ATP-binding protein [Legionella birminghamensis]
MQPLSMIQTVLENIPQLVFWKSTEGSYLGANRHFLQFVGLPSLEALIGKTDSELVASHPVIRYFGEADDQVLMHNMPHSAISRTIRHNNQALTLLMDKSPLLSETGQLIGVVGVVAVNLPHQSPAEIYLKKIIDSVPHIIFWKDIRSVYLGCNQRFASLINLTPDEIVGKSDFELNWRKEEAELFVAGDLDAMSGNAKINVEETFLQADGQVTIMLVSKVPIYDEQGTCIGVLGVSIDITDRKQLEANLQEALKAAQAANLTKTEFIANMSHDIRTPITGIIGMGKMLEDSLENAETKQYAQWLHQSGQQLLTLLNGVLDIISANNPHEDDLINDWFDLTECLNSLAQLELPTIRMKQLSLVLVIGESVPVRLYGDKHKLHRVLLNLIGNAIKFTHQGSVIVKVERVTTDLLQFQVIDTGVGIPEAQQEKVFERFYRATPSHNSQYQGHGIGLHIVQKYVELMGGKIQLTSIEGEGTTVSLIIPITKNPAQIEYLPATQVKNALLTGAELEQTHDTLPKSESDSPKVLLVEDNLIARKMAETLLKKSGCDYLSADSAEAGFQLLQTHDIDIVFTDIGLPGMDGFQVAAQIRQWEKEHNQTPRQIFALTAHAAKELNDAQINKVDQVLTKPLSCAALEEVMKKNRPNTAEAEKKSAQDLNGFNSFPLFDKEQAITQLGSEEEMLNLLNILLCKEIPESRIALQEAFTHHQWEKLERVAHKLKSGAAYCGTRRLFSACEFLEKALKNGYSPSAEPLYEQLQQVLQQTEQALSTYINEIE